MACRTCSACGVRVLPLPLTNPCGPNLTDRAGRFTHCIIVSLPNRDALPAYLDHPEHVPVAEALVADVAELRVMDVEV